MLRNARLLIARAVHSQSASLLANECGALCTVHLVRKADCEEQRCKINRIIEKTQILLPLQRTTLGEKPHANFLFIVLKEKMNFEEFRNKIKSCNICNFKNKHTDPLYFKCKSPENVKCLIITEQPKEDKNNFINEKSVKNDLSSQLKNNKGSTRGWLIDIFDETFSKSIIDESGVYYWTHHTKCPSRKREYREKCINEWFQNELNLFSNLSTIVSFGTEPYRGIISTSDNLNNIKFYDYFWDEIEMIITNNFSKDKLNIIIGGKNYKFLALPHPSSANPLSNLLKRFDSIIEWIKKEF